VLCLRAVSSPSPDQRDYAALLIAKATADRQAVHVLAEADVADELIGFHAQQSVEKAVKAVLVLAGARLPRIHDLERLLALASESGSPPPASVAEAGWLTPWGVQFRYDEAVELLDHDAALAVCDAALGWAVEAFGR
jgi:HEPN domain-containing protein